MKDLVVHLPAPFDALAWVSRRALAVQGSGEDFRRNMVEAYIAMAMQMQDNGLQYVMFTHQDTSVWSHLAGSVPDKIKNRREPTGFDRRYTATRTSPDKNWRDCTAAVL